MKKKIFLFIILFLSLIILVAGLAFLFRVKLITAYMPHVEQTGDIHIKIKNDTTYISSKLTVRNKTFLKIGIDTIKYKISLFDKVYLQNERFIGMVLRAYQIDTLDFSLKIPYVTIIKDLRAQRKIADSASYSINVFLQYSTAFGKLEIPVNRSAKIKIPQPPEIEIIEVKCKKFRWKSIQAIAKIKIVNHSLVTLSISDLNYSMKIVNGGNLKGHYKEQINIKPNEATFVSLPIGIDVNNMGKTLFKVLINRDKYEYTLTLNALLESIDPLKESFQIDLTKSGKMELKK